MASHSLQVAHGPEDVIAFYNLGCVVEREGVDGRELAAGLFEAALRVDPQYGAAANNLGYLREGMGQLEEAEALYRKAVRLNPDRHYTALNNLGKFLHIHRDGGEVLDQAQGETEAERFYKAAIEIVPTYSKALYNLATWLHTRQPQRATDRAEATTLYRKAIAADMTNVEAMYNLATLLMNQDSAFNADNNEATQLLQAAVETRPSYTRASELLRNLRSWQAKRAKKEAARSAGGVG